MEGEGEMLGEEVREKEAWEELESLYVCEGLLEMEGEGDRVGRTEAVKVLVGSPTLAVPLPAPNDAVKEADTVRGKDLRGVLVRLLLGVPVEFPREKVPASPGVRVGGKGEGVDGPDMDTDTLGEALGEGVSVPTGLDAEGEPEGEPDTVEVFEGT